MTTQWLMVSTVVPKYENNDKKVLGMPDVTLLPPNTDVTISTDGVCYKITYRIDGIETDSYLTYGWRAVTNPANKSTQIATNITGHNAKKDWPQALLVSTL